MSDNIADGAGVRCCRYVHIRMGHSKPLCTAVRKVEAGCFAQLTLHGEQTVSLFYAFLCAQRDSQSPHHA